MEAIVQMQSEDSKEDLLRLIRESFLTVALDLGLTEQNAPTNPAFLTMDRLEESFRKPMDYFLCREGEKLLGCMALQAGREGGTYYLERLAVHPSVRHRGIGRKMVERACKEALALGASRLSIGIIDQNRSLKDWYLTLGFKVTGTKDFDHLPFRVCFMCKEL